MYTTRVATCIKTEFFFVHPSGIEPQKQLEPKMKRFDLNKARVLPWPVSILHEKGMIDYTLASTGNLHAVQLYMCIKFIVALAVILIHAVLSHCQP